MFLLPWFELRDLPQVRGALSKQTKMYEFRYINFKFVSKNNNYGHRLILVYCIGLSYVVYFTINILSR